MTDETTLPSAPAPMGAEHWSAEFGVDDATREALKKYGTAEDALRGIAAANDMIGRSVVFPKDNDPDDKKAEAMTKIYRRLGMPESPDKYKIQKPDKLPEGVEWDEGAAQELCQFAHQHHWTQAHLDSALDFHTRQTAKRAEAYAKAVADAAKKTQDDAIVAIKGFEGVGEANYQPYMNDCGKAVRFIDQKIGGGLVDMLNQTGIGNHPLLVKVFHWIHDTHLKEGTLVPGEPTRPGDARTVREKRFPNSPEMDKMGGGA